MVKKVLRIHQGINQRLMRFLLYSRVYLLNYCIDKPNEGFGSLRTTHDRKAIHGLPRCPWWIRGSILRKISQFLAKNDRLGRISFALDSYEHRGAEHSNRDNRG